MPFHDGRNYPSLSLAPDGPLFISVPFPMDGSKMGSLIRQGHLVFSFSLLMGLWEFGDF